MTTVLVTGGSGFIGSNLCDFLLDEKYNVINIDNFNNFYDPQIKRKNIEHNLNNPNYSLVEGDIRDLGLLKKVFNDNNIDVIIHLAAMAGVRPSIEDPLLYEDVNVKGTINLLEMCRMYKIDKFLCASSSSVYGNNKKAPFSETDVVDYSISPYAATKKSCEVFGHVYHSLYNIDMIMLRFFTVYGPRQRPDLAIHKFTNLISESKEIPFYGDGLSERDYTYIDDIIDGIVKSLYYVINNSNVYEIINLGESHTISLSKMVNKIEDELGIQAKLNKLPMQPGDVQRTYADITKAKSLIGYNPQIDFNDGIKKFIKWYKEESLSCK
ncbi:GDP-mannose 4,6-dehydratase [Bacillus toyonensis]|uniref:Epimerase n=1 Tax=Bacillus toyonensis TaxID=155322 RepID=A0A2B5XX77_9BACI|nr:GDP-mannose 4,6-dehydratase [Bacillus toyonensis]PGB00911.1 epimerase [Bacillus toyonensis]PHD71894.1 epimerase [Bacillus toyonensis]